MDEVIHQSRITRMGKIPSLEFLSHKMSRREFLTHVGLLVLLVTGVTGILNALSDSSLSPQRAPSHTKGFSAGSYGG